MEIRKHNRYDLERKRGLFFQLGLLFSLSITLMAFEWRTSDKTDSIISEQNNSIIPEEIIPVTQQKVPLPAAGQAIQKIKNNNSIIELIDDPSKQDIITDNNGSDLGSDTVSGTINGIPINEDNSRDAEIFTIVDVPPAFPGGEEMRMKFLQKNVSYPRFAREHKVQGAVYATFVVEPDGSLTHIKILQGIGSGCDEEAYRVVTIMPKWIPGKKNGKEIRVQVTMPLVFTLQASN